MGLLKWPVSEDLIGRKVKCLKNNSDAWLYEEGDVYVIGADSDGDVGPVDEEGFAPSDKTREELFSFELLPEEEEVPSITTTIAPSLIPEGYEFVRIGEAEYGEVYVGFENNQYRTPSPVTAQTNTCCAVVVIRKVEPKTKIMYNIHTGEPVEVPYALNYSPEVSISCLGSDMYCESEVSLGFISKEPAHNFLEKLFTQESN